MQEKVLENEMIIIECNAGKANNETDILYGKINRRTQREKKKLDNDFRRFRKSI